MFNEVSVGMLNVFIDKLVQDIPRANNIHNIIIYIHVYISIRKLEVPGYGGSFFKHEAEIISRLQKVYNG